MALPDRTAEIWATRVKREVLALTATSAEKGEDDTSSSPAVDVSTEIVTASDNNKDGEDDGKAAADDAEADEVSSHDTPKHDNLNIATLPPFVKVRDHVMNIDAGVAKVTFAVEVEVVPDETTSKQGTESPATTDEKSEEDPTMTTAADDNKKSEVTPPPSDPKPKTSKMERVLITLDASIDFSVTHHTSCYPFQKPRVVLTDGSRFFCPSSTIKDGDFIDLDCDWTPSLHLSDAILNVALKVRESIKRREPFSPAAPTRGGLADGNFLGLDGTSSAIMTDRMATVADEISASVSNFLGNLRRGDKENVAGGGKQGTASAVTKKKKSTEVVETKKVLSFTERQAILDKIQIGSTINMNGPPFDKLEGMYSVKAIRRPKHVETAIAKAEAKTAPSSGAEGENAPPSTGGGSGGGRPDEADNNGRNRIRRGLMGASTFLKSVEKTLVQSTKSFVEEHFLMLTESHILEVKTSKFNMDQATVTFVSPVSLLTKLKFRREESISLFFKHNTEDPLIYLCPESANAVTEIQKILKRHGVRGKHTNSATQRQIQLALKLVSLIRSKESQLDNASSDTLSRDADTMMERVNEIMDLYRQAAELFENAGDVRHSEVVAHMQAFLAKPLTASILDKSYTGPSALSIETSGEGDAAAKIASPSSFEDTMKTVDDMMKEVENLGLRDSDTSLDDGGISALASDESIPDTTAADVSGVSLSDDHDPFSELDAMLSEADKELENIMNGSDD